MLVIVILCTCIVLATLCVTDLFLDKKLPKIVIFSVISILIVESIVIQILKRR